MTMEEPSSGATNCDVTVSSDICVTSGPSADHTNSWSNSSSPNAKHDYIDEETGSVCSTQSGDTMGGEDRELSSFSCNSSKGTRIPRLSSSGSFREKTNRHSEKFCSGERNNPYELAKPDQRTGPCSIGGLTRSRSFATSRGMTGLVPSLGNLVRGRPPLTPELIRRKLPSQNFTYVSPYSRQAIAVERKTARLSQGMFTSQLMSSNGSHPQHSCYSSRRLSLPHCSSLVSHYVTDVNEVDSEDRLSESSFCSLINESHTHCAEDASAGMVYGGRRPRNVLHCSHGHDQQDPSEYLTPTQRAARKIRELQAALKRAHREIVGKDEKISSLTRALVELRINKAETDDGISGERTNRRQLSKVNICDQIMSDKSTESEEIPHLALRSFSPSADTACLSPPSDSSEFELTKLEGEADDGKGKQVEGSSSSPAERSLIESDSGDVSRSLADSGHYEDLPSPCLSPSNSVDTGRAPNKKFRGSSCSPEGDLDRSLIWAAAGVSEEGVREELARRVEELKESHMEEYQELKERHNDRVEMLLSKLSDANLRYFELRPQYDKSLEKIRVLEETNTKLKEELHECELRQQKVYLQMYLKGQQAAKFEAEEKLSNRTTSSHHLTDPDITKLTASIDNGDSEPLVSNSVIITMMKQLSQAEEEVQKLKIQYSDEISRAKRGYSGSSFGLKREEIDPAITLQFLKSAIYYFLTDRENAQGHLKAIESILGYSAMERGNISKRVRL